MDYQLKFTEKFINRGIERLFEVIKINNIDWSLNEDLIQMVSSIKPYHYESFLNCVIDDEDFNFFEYSRIIISRLGLNEIGLTNYDKVVFSLFDDIFIISKTEFHEMVVQMIDLLILNFDRIKELKIDIVNDQILLKKRQIIFFKANSYNI